MVPDGGGSSSNSSGPIEDTELTEPREGWTRPIPVWVQPAGNTAGDFAVGEEFVKYYVHEAAGAEVEIVFYVEEEPAGVHKFNGEEILTNQVVCRIGWGWLDEDGESNIDNYEYEHGVQHVSSEHLHAYIECAERCAIDDDRSWLADLFGPDFTFTGYRRTLQRYLAYRSRLITTAAA